MVLTYTVDSVGQQVALLNVPFAHWENEELGGRGQAPALEGAYVILLH